jgi:hypothetical protein
MAWEERWSAFELCLSEILMRVAELVELMSDGR